MGAHETTEEPFCFKPFQSKTAHTMSPCEVPLQTRNQQTCPEHFTMGCQGGEEGAGSRKGRDEAGCSQALRTRNLCCSPLVSGLPVLREQPEPPPLWVREALCISRHHLRLSWGSQRSVLRLTDSWPREEENHMHEFPNIEMKNGASGEAARIIKASIQALVCLRSMGPCGFH